MPVAGHEHFIHLFTVYPLTAAELDFKLDQGLKPFLERAWEKRSNVVNVSRPSLI